MSDYISREETLESLLGWAAQLTETYGKNDEYVRCLESAAYNIEQIHAADVRPVRRGKWKNNHCSACGMMPMGEEIWESCDFDPPKFEWFMNYCPNCGADMRGES